MTGLRNAILLVAGLMPGLAVAQMVTPCDGYAAAAQSLAEPWEANTRLYANGAVRLAVMDTVEPAAAAFHLMILSPPYDELGLRQCALVSGAEGGGFAGLNLGVTEARYDPAQGLIFAIEATRWLPDTDSYVPATLHVVLNQSTGAIGARLD